MVKLASLYCPIITGLSESKFKSGLESWIPKLLLEISKFKCAKNGLYPHLFFLQNNTFY